MSNQEIRNRLKTKHSIFEPFFRKVVKCDFEGVMDVGIWNINAINEIKKIPDIELHIVSTYRNLIANRQDFDIDGIHYHFIKDENSSLVRKVRRYLFERYSAKFMLNRKRICKLINEIKPDIVHMFGAENVWYSLALLDLPKNIPTILQLQALLVSIKLSLIHI